jgi:hypothetical protein
MPSPEIPSRRTLLIGAILLCILVVELAVPAYRQSQTADEGYHIFSGYNSWTRGDFGINPEVPPFVKMVAALPVLPLSLRVPPPSNIPFKLAEFFGAKPFLYSNDADVILFRARMAAAVFTVLLAVLVFVAAYEMFDAACALLALALFVFEPNLIAHGSLVTTDVASALFLFATVYAFYRYIKRPSALRLLLVGLLAGLSLASKDSGVLYFPILVCLLAVELVRLAEPAQQDSVGESFGGARQAIRLVSSIVWSGLIAVAILWVSYGLRYQARPTGQSLIPSLAEYAAQLDNPRETQFLVLLARYHVLPEAYLYGWADTLNTRGHISPYLFGTVYRHPVWFYFPAVFVIKSTIGFLLLLLLVPLALWRRWADFRREFLFLLIPPLVYFPFAMASKFNIGVRHLLPTYPSLIILAAVAACLLIRSDRRWLALVIVLVALHIGSSLRAFPNYIAYANEFWGGSERSYKVLSDSNVDWAQQLKQTRKYLDDRGIKDCWFAYFDQVFVDPSYYHIPCKTLPTGLSRQTLTAAIPAQIQGTVLLSASELSGEFWGPGSLNPYAQFRNLRPDDVIGGGVLVFRGQFNLPLVSAISHQLAAIRFLQGGYLDRALQEAQTAVSLAPDDASSQALLGDALTQLKQKDDAREAYQRALLLARTVYPDFQSSMVPLLQDRLAAN